MPQRAARQPMTHLIDNDRLNDLLIALARSLLQYVGECWPWIGVEESDEKAVVDRLVAEQRESVQKLADLLWRRDHPVDFGSYPTKYTSLHFVALDYLLDRLIEEQRALAAECEEIADYAFAQVDPEATRLLADIRDQAQRHLRELERLAKARGEWVKTDHQQPRENV